MNSHERDLSYMKQAISEAYKSSPVDSAYSVGAVLTSPDVHGKYTVKSTGYSRELPGNTHAEECCLLKLSQYGDPLNLEGCTMYTTMEPCSLRLSGKTSCSTLLIAAAISRVVVGIREPPHFVKCTGVDDLRKAGIQVDFLEDLEEECKAPNGHLIQTKS